MQLRAKGRFGTKAFNLLAANTRMALRFLQWATACKSRMTQNSRRADT